MKKYNIENFYIGELYLYKNFAGFISESYNKDNNSKVDTFEQTGAINFMQAEESKQIDWINKREYTGFLTIFYKQDNKYICLHDGIPYEINGDNFIKNLIPLNELLPKISSKILSKISMGKALELFNILFKNNKEETLYTEIEYPVSDFIIGDIILKEVQYQELTTDIDYSYIDLPYHTMLNKSNLSIQSFRQDNYINTVYRCLFLKDGVDLYNINNHQFYNPNEDIFQTLINFRDYTQIKPSKDSISIPKALKKFKQTI